MVIVGKTAAPASDNTGIRGYGSRRGGRDDGECVDAHFQTASPVITRSACDEAIQSRPVERFWIASLALAMTAERDAPPRSRDTVRPRFAKKFSRLRKNEGAGNAGCSMHPQPRVQ